MAVEIVMPRFGWTMEEGLLAEWTKQDGDSVRVGDVLFTVESDKALNEVESFENGILRIPPNSPPVGSTVRVGALLAYVVQPGERAPFEDQPASTLPPATLAASELATPTAEVAGGALPAAPDAPARPRHAVSPRARRVAAELNVDFTRVRGSGRTGRVIERDVRAASQLRPAPSEVRASPLARRAAAELGVDLEQLSAVRPGQRLERADVEAAARQAARPPAAAGVVAPATKQVVPVSSVRRLTAERMLAGAHNTAPVTLTTEG